MLETNKENAVEFLTGDKTVTVSFTAQKYVNKMKKLHEKHSDKFEAYEINPDGSLYARIPLKWLKISIPRTNNMNEEQRIAAAERLRNARLNKLSDNEFENNEFEIDEDLTDDD